MAQQIEKFEAETKLKDTEIQLLTEQNQRLSLTTEIESTLFEIDFEFLPNVLSNCMTSCNQNSKE
jgi:hypothetical protein